MKVEYSERAIEDLYKLAAKSHEFGDVVAEAVGVRISEVIARIAWEPQSSRKVSQRSGVHIAPLGKFPFVIFYRILEDRVKILHVRHTLRQPWKGK